MKFPFYKQPDAKDCGPTCLKIVSKYYGKVLSIQTLRSISETTREGSSLRNISDAAEKIGYRTQGVKLCADDLPEITLPCILHWNNNHYVILYKKKSDKYYISDPNIGLLIYNEDEFLKHWIGNNSDKYTKAGIALLLEPSPYFYTFNDDLEDKAEIINFKFLLKYLIKYKDLIVQLVVGLIAATILQLIFPFLTQSIVDIGIQNRDIHFVYLILFAQLSIFIGRTIIEALRNRILLHLSSRINIALVSDFFIKLMCLPISYFDVKMTGDIIQRINDQKRIERVLTSTSLTGLFSIVNILIMSSVLAYYNMKIFLIFIFGSLLYFGWIMIFLKKREQLDYRRFSEVSQEQSKVVELINGMQEIKLHNAEKQKRWEWENIQVRLFKISLKSLSLEQTQSIGSGFINELKNILIVFISAKLVIDGVITLGIMMAITTIVGGLNSPIMQLIIFIREIQDAKISLSRLSEIHQMTDEREEDNQKASSVPNDIDIEINNLTFKYTGTTDPVLEKLDLTIPANKITAIVGVSGSGKTTLLKLLLKFYQPDEGKIILKNGSSVNDLKNIKQETWRSLIGTVMQDGYIFNDTIANNIALGIDEIDLQRLKYSSEIANINYFIDRLPLGYNTKIGTEGLGLSTGQMQRLLIARAVYKDPQILLFDEATSALDANNEKEIMEKLNVFFKDKTVIIIAHRLSTVMNADQIVVLDQGRIIEMGNHNDLVNQKGNYYQLVKNQLQLGK